MLQPPLMNSICPDCTIWLTRYCITFDWLEYQREK